MPPGKGKKGYGSKKMCDLRKRVHAERKAQHLLLPGVLSDFLEKEKTRAVYVPARQNLEKTGGVPQKVQRGKGEAARERGGDPPYQCVGGQAAYELWTVCCEEMAGGTKEMSKIDTYTKNRTEGLAWALDLIRKCGTPEEGIEMLRKEIRFRKAVFIPLEIPAENIRRCSELLANRMMNTILVVILMVLEEEYGWREKRLKRFTELYAEYSGKYLDEDPYGDRYIVMTDYANYFREKYGVNFSAEVLDDMMEVERQNRENRERRVKFDAIERLLKDRYPEALEYLKERMEVQR